MNLLSQIEKFEKDYDVIHITYKNASIWPYIRIYLSHEILKTGKIIADKKTILNALGNFFNGFWNLFKKADYIFFTDQADRKLINNQYYDRIDFLSEKYKRNIVFELTTTTHYNKNLIPTKNIVSKIPLYFFTKIIKIFIKTSGIKNLQTINKLLSDNNITFNISSLLKEYVAQYIIANFLIKLYHPKALILAPSYTNFPYIQAFKEKGIPVIEFQHGLIIKEHLAYNYTNCFGNTIFPDYIFTYGNFEKTIFNNNNHFIDSNKVIPIGHFYLNYIKTNYREDKILRSKSATYKYRIAVTLQTNYENKLMDFITEAALNKDILFIIVPRNNKHTIMEKENIILNTNLNCYEAILNCDFHCTIFSSCAIEAIGLGKQNILVNIDGKSKEYLEFLLDDGNHSYIINSVEEFYTVISNNFHKDINEISQKYFKENYVTNLNLEFDKIFDK